MGHPNERASQIEIIYAHKLWKDLSKLDGNHSPSVKSQNIDIYMYITYIYITWYLVRAVRI